MGLWIGLGILAIVVLYSIGAYNALVRKKVYVDEASSRIDVNLKQKINVLNNLVDLLKMQTNYESGTLQKVIDARNLMKTDNMEQALKANDQLTKSVMPSIMALAESYPELRANEGFVKVMEEVETCESKVAFARTAYNTAVFAYNTAILTFPSSVFAGIFQFKKAEMYELDDVQKQQADDYRIGQQ